MIVDTSAVMTILFGESGAERYDTAIAEARRCRMSVVNFLEAAIVLESRSGAAAGHELDAFLREAEIELAEVTAEQAQAARRAWRRFGKSNHPAGLNFGDCFAYALAEATGEPLLFKGGDFALTDVEPA
ncbi:MAG: type II toxin-antitoxin system VapC family toxin [Chloroflexi bacterium]|nr:type II toxin-antitoxin system VapC family toxin [Chloroflexota bacterium]MCY3939268.1 type II toxin-antitoxin system VapC family toxin [Chloroflexota bacterium]